MKLCLFIVTVLVLSKVAMSFDFCPAEQLQRIIVNIIRVCLTIVAHNDRVLLQLGN